ncbi:hypothetical protein C8Q78DRAFT_316388 [Trametes maxima]|nr:hypothetical protein C8Q78DRAFT_316388 [Trametes maxima]
MRRYDMSYACKLYDPPPVLQRVYKIRSIEEAKLSIVSIETPTHLLVTNSGCATGALKPLLPLELLGAFPYEHCAHSCILSTVPSAPRPGTTSLNHGNKFALFARLLVLGQGCKSLGACGSHGGDIGPRYVRPSLLGTLMPELRTRFSVCVRRSRAAKRRAANVHTSNSDASTALYDLERHSARAMNALEPSRAGCSTGFYFLSLLIHASVLYQPWT